MKRTTARAELERLVSQDLGRELSARTILFHQAVADRVGITPTEMKCLDFISRSDDVTAGDLSRITGLTTGAVTALIDRLVEAGLVVRQRGETDRRKVFVRLAKSTKMLPVHSAFDHLSRRMGKLVSGYTVAELETIQSFLLDCTQMLREVTDQVRAEGKGRQ